MENPSLFPPLDSPCGPSSSFHEAGASGVRGGGSVLSHAKPGGATDGPAASTWPPRMLSPDQPPVGQVQFCPLLQGTGLQSQNHRGGLGGALIVSPVGIPAQKPSSLPAGRGCHSRDVCQLWEGESSRNPPGTPTRALFARLNIFIYINRWLMVFSNSLPLCFLSLQAD